MATRIVRYEALTVRQRLVLAAASLEQQGTDPWTVADLAVRAWLRGKDRFGMPGYEHAYPCSNYVATFLMGARGLIGRNGWVMRCGGGRFRLTSAGYAEARRLLALSPDRLLPAAGRTAG